MEKIKKIIVWLWFFINKNKKMKKIVFKIILNVKYTLNRINH